MKTQQKNKVTDFSSNVLKLGLLLLILFANVSIALAQKKEMNLEVKKDVKWFTDARFGMFIHWTPLGAIDQEIGWSWGNQVPKETYIKMCKEWNPTKFDADEWVRIAKNAGMKYIVFVPKHHDVFHFGILKQPILIS